MYRNPCIYWDFHKGIGASFSAELVTPNKRWGLRRFIPDPVSPHYKIHKFVKACKHRPSQAFYVFLFRCNKTQRTTLSDPIGDPFFCFLKVFDY
jgi:hypothetical protein